MDMRADSGFETMSAVAEFTLDVAADRAKTYDTLLHRGRRVTEVEGRILEAQFRLPDGGTLLLLNDDQPFKEKLTLILVDSELRVLDRLELGGAFTPGFLTYAYPVGPDEVAFCWHDLDQIVTVRRYRRRLALRSRWLKVRELSVQRVQPAVVQGARAVAGASAPSRARRQGRAIPSLVWLAWLSLRVFRFRRVAVARGRGPRR